MRHDEYLAWIKAHLTTFGALNPANVATLTAWFPAFDAMLATSHELQKSTYAVLSLESQPVGWGSHFVAIRTEIVRQRAEQAKRQVEDYSAPDRGACVLCGGSGIVVVPHPKHCSAEGWRPIYTASGKEYYPTAGVLCTCSVGMRAAQLQVAKDESQRSLSLETYKLAANGNWREQMRERREAVTTIRQVESAIDPKALIQQLAKRTVA